MTSLAVVGAVLVGAAAVVALAFAGGNPVAPGDAGSTPGSRAVKPVAYVVGQCALVSGDGADASQPELVPCQQRHTLEVVGIAAVRSSTFPTSAQWQAFAASDCLPLAQSYLGRPLDAAGAVQLTFVHPERTGWLLGDRHVTCALEQVAPDGSPMAVTGSVKDHS